MIGREDIVDIMVIHLGVDSAKVVREASDTRGAHARFSFLEKLYKDHLEGVLNVEGDDVHVEYHRQCALRCYLLFLVNTSIFVDKTTTYINMVYLKYFIDLTAIHEYNWEPPICSICTQS